MAPRLRTPQGGRASGILSIRGPEVSPGSLRVEVYMASRLQRRRGRFQHISANSLNHPTHLCMNYLAMASRSPRWAPAPAYAVQATTHYQTYLERPPGADLPPKKVCNLDPMAPRSRKIHNYPRAPSSRRSGLVGPHTTPMIVNYKYMTSTRREGYFWLPTLGT